MAPPAEAPVSRLTITPSDFHGWLAGTPDRPDLAAVPEDRPPSRVTPPPPPPVLVTPPPPPPATLTPLPAPAMPPPEPPQIATLPPDSRDTTPVPAVPGALPRPVGIRILYAAEATDLPAAARKDLDTLAAWLQATADARVEIVGYASETSKTGSKARRRSLLRVLAVRTYLIENGVLSTRMDVRALGGETDTEPKDRVEIRLPPSGGT